MTFSRKFDFSHTGWGVYVAIIPSFRLEKHFYSDKMLSGSRENTSKLQKCRFRHKNQVKMYVENEEIRKKSYGFLKIPPGGIRFHLILHLFLLLFRRPRPPSDVKNLIRRPGRNLPLPRFFCKSTCIFLIFVRFIFATALLHYLIGCQNQMSESDSIIEKSKTKSHSDDINEVTKEPLTTAYETV